MNEDNGLAAGAAAGGSFGLLEAAKEMRADHMTSEKHHPDYVLVPASSFEKLIASVVEMEAYSHVPPNTTDPVWDGIRHRGAMAVNAGRAALAGKADAGEKAGLTDDPLMSPGEYETVEEANAAGMFSGTLANGDTFEDEDDGEEGGYYDFSSDDESIVERAARSICLVHGYNPDDDAPRSAICGPNNETLPWWRFFEEDARAALNPAPLPIGDREDPDGLGCDDAEFGMKP